MHEMLVDDRTFFPFLPCPFLYHLGRFLQYEKWPLLDALYFSIVTASTVGYGDVVPQEIGAKWFTIFYMLFGFGLFTIVLVKRGSSNGWICRKDRYTLWTYTTSISLLTSMLHPLSLIQSARVRSVSAKSRLLETHQLVEDLLYASDGRNEELNRNRRWNLAKALAIQLFFLLCFLGKSHLLLKPPCKKVILTPLWAFFFFVQVLVPYFMH